MKIKKSAQIISFICLILFVIVFWECVGTDYGTSEIFTKKEIKSAIDKVKENFNDFDGCKVLSLSYAGDDKSIEELKYWNNYDEIIVINSVFISPIIKKNHWSPFEIYTWKFILAKNNYNSWEIISCGYG